VIGGTKLEKKEYSAIYAQGIAGFARGSGASVTYGKHMAGRLYSRATDEPRVFVSIL